MTYEIFSRFSNSDESSSESSESASSTEESDQRGGVEEKGEGGGTGLVIEDSDSAEADPDRRQWLAGGVKDPEIWQVCVCVCVGGQSCDKGIYTDYNDMYVL